MQQFDVFMLTALITIVVLAAISAVLVVGYRRTHAEQIRQELLRKAARLGVPVERSMEEPELRRLIRQSGVPLNREPKNA